MVEVFKTNVQEPDQAARLLQLIHLAFPRYEATFDLEDCDKILRIKCTAGTIIPEQLVGLLEVAGYTAELLEDEIPMPRVHWGHPEKHWTAAPYVA